MNEELYWRQKFRVTWLKLGIKIKNSFIQNNWQEKKKHSSWYCRQRKQLDRGPWRYYEGICGLPCDFISINKSLGGQYDCYFSLAFFFFSKEELKTTLFQLNPLKAPCSDVIPALFFRKYWNLVQEKVTRVCFHFLIEGGNIS